VSRPSGVRIVIAGGHSAGHIEPALAFADAVRARAQDAVITALGTVRGLDTTLIPPRGYALELIPPAPLARRVNLDLLRTPARLVAAVRAAGVVLERVGAEAVVGFGGYVALPAYLAGRRRGLPLVVHEANAQPGLANRVAAMLTTHVYTASSDIRLRHARAIGIPVRPEIAGLDRPARRAQARAEFGLPATGPVVLVTGGSQGAQAINRTVDAVAPDLVAAGVNVLHITGPANVVAAERVRRINDTEGRGVYVAVPFVDGMDRAYAAADLVICRSGAMTCAELAAVGLPAVFVPLPLRGGEQRRNAEPVVAAGGGLLVSNADFTADWVRSRVLPLVLDPDRLVQMARRARRAGHADAAGVLADEVLALIAARRRDGVITREPPPGPPRMGVS
jgi:UDP-N-acetylglucosamine--N-acetylmuramyl-(pentapeptide) pyrophosphoryl-undecaprenol N-acetylglucosamine transferase